jgi:hypothetical protein
LSAPKYEAVATDQLKAWGQWIEWRLGASIELDGGAYAKHIPKILNEFSLDGAMRLVLRFGLIEDHAHSVRVGTWRSLENMGVIGVVTRGLSRLEQLENSQEVFFEVGSLVHLPILERMRSDGVEPADSVNAANLVLALKNKSHESWDRRVKFPQGQLSLFTWQYR